MCKAGVSGGSSLVKRKTGPPGWSTRGETPANESLAHAPPLAVLIQGGGVVILSFHSASGLNLVRAAPASELAYALALPSFNPPAPFQDRMTTQEQFACHTKTPSHTRGRVLRLL